MTLDAGRYRAEFPIFEETVYINSCSYGGLSSRVRAALVNYLNDRDSVGADWEKWVGLNEELRTAFARLLGAGRHEIAVTASASAGINAVASALDFSNGRNKIVVTDFEFPTAAQIWHAQSLKGAEIVHVAPDEDGATIDLERIRNAIDARTALVCASHVCYRNGSMQDIAAIARAAHDKGALMMADSFQALGSLPIDVKALDVDFLVGGVLKYLLGSAGVAMLYVRESLIEALTPTASGWFAQEDVNAMDITANRPSPTASRFEAGTPPVPNLYAALAGLEIIEEAGTQAIRDHVLGLHDAIIEGVHDLGGAFATPLDAQKRGAMLAVASKDDHALVAAMAGEGVIASCRDGNLRLSPHLYNTKEDVEVVLKALHKHKGLLS